MLSLLTSSLAVAGAISLTQAQGGCTPGDDSYDYLLLVEQWPETQGMSGYNYFTLHGLWPSRNSSPSSASTYPCQCTNEAFDENLLLDILPDMNKFWPSYKGNNPQFWSHEWGKHGTCARFQDQFTFFKTALLFRTEVDTMGSLKTAGILPGSSYSATDMGNAIAADAGAHPTFGCKSGNVLSEIGFCFDKLGHVQECSENVLHLRDEVTSCDVTQDIKFPAPKWDNVN